MLDGVQKFNYLRTQLQGDAASVIAGLPLTTVNYSNAMALLAERFRQPTQDNPADLLTRGITYETLAQCKLWSTLYHQS